MLTAFLLNRTKNEKELSANWLRERKLGIEGALDFVRRVFKRKPYELKETGRFAILNVGEIRMLQHKLIVKHKRTDDDPCHSEIIGSYGLTLERERELAMDLRNLLSDTDIYPALK